MKAFLWRLAIIAALLGTAVPELSAQTGPRDDRFGVIEAFWTPDAATESGAAWERTLFTWSHIQPNGPEDWNTLTVREEWLSTARATGREVVGVIKNTPAWATDGTPESGLPRGLYLPVDDPANTWAAFVRRLAAYYAPLGVHRWIVWNEPDIDPETYGHEFEGTVEDYARLLKVAYLAAKETDPRAIIHLAGLTWWHDVVNNREPYLARLLDVLMADPEAREHDFYFDVASMHVYFQTDTVYDIAREMLNIMRDRGIEKPLWINETNASPNLDPLWPVERPRWQVTLEDQASFILQAFAMGLAAGVERIGVYKLYDGNLPPGGESFGLIRVDGSRRPAFDAFRLVTREYAGTQSAHLAQIDQVSVVALRQPDRTVLVMWARTGAPVRLRVEVVGEDVTLLDREGTQLEVVPDSGVYPIRLEGASCPDGDGCAIGGRTLLFIQPGPPPDVRLMDGTFVLKGEDVPAPTPPQKIANPTPTATPPPTWTPRPILKGD